MTVYGLTDEHTMIADTVRSFVENEIYPHEDLVERTGEVPQDIADEIKRKTIELGFYACNFPESAGGAGLNHLEFALVERELGRGSMALNHFFGRPQNILMACEGEQIERYRDPAIRGERMDALAMTEPGAGSDVRGMKCSAVRDGGDWVLNGTKHFISGADHADFLIVFVATGEDQTPRGPKKRITTFLVDRGTPGFTIRDGYKSVSHRGYKNMILEFDDCRLPDAQVLAADLLTLAAADRLDQGLPANREIASAKLYASEMLGRVTDAAIQVHGGMGLMDDYPLERFWRDARVERIWDGTSEIQRHIISRELLRALGA